MRRACPVAFCSKIEDGQCLTFVDWPIHAPKLPTTVATTGAINRCVNPESSVLAIAKAPASDHPLRLNSAHVATYPGSGGAAKNSIAKPAVTPITMQTPAARTDAIIPEQIVPSCLAVHAPAIPQIAKRASIPAICRIRTPNDKWNSILQGNVDRLDQSREAAEHSGVPQFHVPCSASLHDNHNDPARVRHQRQYRLQQKFPCRWLLQKRWTSLHRSHGHADRGRDQDQQRKRKDASPGHPAWSLQPCSIETKTSGSIVPPDGSFRLHFLLQCQFLTIGHMSFSGTFIPRQ